MIKQMAKIFKEFKKQFCWMIYHLIWIVFLIGLWSMKIDLTGKAFLTSLILVLYLLLFLLITYEDDREVVYY